jgi:NAD(P)-dependent dehydrogenase (short-subunit alcohol dehydrogenase family)
VQSKTAPFCLITGAAGGIGLSLVNTFVDAGYIVIATDVLPRPDNFRGEYFIQADLNQLSEDAIYAENILNQIRVCLSAKSLQVLINNAAIQVLGSVKSLNRADWCQSLNVNLISPFLLSQGLLSELKRGMGCVINISSIHARQTKNNFVAYATSKAGLSGLTRAMAIDLGGQVRVIGIEPAAIETDMLRAGFKGDPKGYQQLNSIHPLGRVGIPDEVAKLSLAIASGGMDFINGVCIGIDGGISSKLVDPL